jgi:hypothetical protein
MGGARKLWRATAPPRPVAPVYVALFTPVFTFWNPIYNLLYICDTIATSSLSLTLHWAMYWSNLKVSTLQSLPVTLMLSICSQAYSRHHLPGRYSWRNLVLDYSPRMYYTWALVAWCRSGYSPSDFTLWTLSFKNCSTMVLWHADSSWSLPLHLIPKKEEGWRPMETVLPCSHIPGPLPLPSHCWFWPPTRGSYSFLQHRLAEDTIKFRFT